MNKTLEIISEISDWSPIKSAYDLLDNEGKAVIDFNTTNNGILMMKHSVEAGWDSILYIWLDGKWENYDKIKEKLN